MSDIVDRVTDVITGIMWTEDFDGTDATQRALHREAACGALKTIRDIFAAAGNSSLDLAADELDQALARDIDKK